MNKLVFSIGLSFLIINGYCSVHSLVSKGSNHEPIDLSLLPQSGEGVKIVPDSEMYHFPLSAKEKKALVDIEKIGYVKKKSLEAINLLKYKKSGFLSSEDKIFYNSNEEMDTHLKHSLSQIKLAFTHKPLSFVTPENSIGFAAAITFKGGWTGVTQIFKHNVLDVCNYLKTNVALNGSAVRLSKERISFYINGKPAVAVNEGREEDGFLYSIEWYDNQYFHDLTCAQPRFSEKSLAEIKKISLSN